MFKSKAEKSKEEKEGPMSSLRRHFHDIQSKKPQQIKINELYTFKP